MRQDIWISFTNAGERDTPSRAQAILQSDVEACLTTLAVINQVAERNADFPKAVIKRLDNDPSNCGPSYRG